MVEVGYHMWLPGVALEDRSGKKSWIENKKADREIQGDVGTFKTSKRCPIVDHYKALKWRQRRC